MNLGLILVILGAVVVVGTIVAFFVPYMFFDWFTYRFWVVHAIIAAGAIIAITGWILGGPAFVAIIAIVLAVGWFVLTTVENRIPGSRRLAVGPGDPLPAFRLTTVDGRTVDERDVTARAPALLVFYRGWWCPTSRMQMHDLLDAYDELAAAGLTIYAASVDGAEEAAPLQELVGDRITILCGLDAATLDAVGAHDTRGRPWFTRPFVGGTSEMTAMPTSLVVDRAGRILMAHRAKRVDDRPVPLRWLRSPRLASS
ncbi:redoxin domain-containing protein [Agromyces tropicus]|uniref:redoxin domain-containing protein n=1 Tax=Agromyces tropicus TaxID=555371 RepID=UPI0031DEEDF5